MKRPIIRTVGAELAGLALKAIVLVITTALLVHLCGCWGAPFTAAADAQLVTLGDAGDVLADARASFQVPPAADAGDELAQLGPDAGDVARQVDAGDEREDAARTDAGAGVVSGPECASSLECPVCPGVPPRFACCHAGACGCVGEGELCSP